MWLSWAWAWAWLRLNKEATDERFFASFGRGAAKVKREGVVGRMGDTAGAGCGTGEEADADADAEAAEDEVGLDKWWAGEGEVGEGLGEVDEDVCGEQRGQR